MKYSFLLLVAGWWWVLSCQSGIEQKSLDIKSTLDSLENVFDNANWQCMLQDDTTYLFFSRQNDTSLAVYFYRLQRGDSVGTYAGRIGYANDHLAWDWPDKQILVLQNISGAGSRWQAQNDTSSAYTFSRVDSSTISCRYAGRPGILKKTLPIATFLVRSRYDVEHGTHTAGSPEIPRRAD